MTFENNIHAPERRVGLRAQISPSLAELTTRSAGAMSDSFPDCRYAVLDAYLRATVHTDVTVGDLTPDEQAALGFETRVETGGYSKDLGGRPARVFIPAPDHPLTLGEYDRLVELRENVT